MPFGFSMARDWREGEKTVWSRYLFSGCLPVPLLEASHVAGLKVTASVKGAFSSLFSVFSCLILVTTPSL